MCSADPGLCEIGYLAAGFAGVPLTSSRVAIRSSPNHQSAEEAARQVERRLRRRGGHGAVFDCDHGRRRGCEQRLVVGHKQHRNAVFVDD